MRIVILENSKSYGETVEEYLRGRGHTVTFINTTQMSVEEAIRQASQHRPDRVLVDCLWNDRDNHDISGVRFVRGWSGKAVLMSSERVNGYDGPFVSKTAGLAAIEKALQ